MNLFAVKFKNTFVVSLDKTGCAAIFFSNATQRNATQRNAKKCV